MVAVAGRLDQGGCRVNGVEIRLLGPLEVSSQGHPVEVAGRRLRLLLAVLALQARRVVEAERLVDLLWPAAGLPADPARSTPASAWVEPKCLVSPSASIASAMKCLLCSNGRWACAASCAGFPRRSSVAQGLPRRSSVSPARGSGPPPYLLAVAQDPPRR